MARNFFIELLQTRFVEAHEIGRRQPGSACLHSLRRWRTHKIDSMEDNFCTWSTAWAMLKLATKCAHKPPISAHSPTPVPHALRNRASHHQRAHDETGDVPQSAAVSAPAR